ncbi:hypothetical protein L7F22_024750 [Adiantum nelumboides]|nr:hypothetical protein [Adiantum nelumboides]
MRHEESVRECVKAASASEQGHITIASVHERALKPSRALQSIFAQYAPCTSEPSNKDGEVTVSHISPANYLKLQQSFLISDSLSIEPNSASNSLQLLAHYNIHRLSDLRSVDSSITPLESLTLVNANFSPLPSVLNEIFAAKVSSGVLQAFSLA